jgi:hypothetical protein
VEEIMTSTVEIRLIGDDLAGVMRQMRTWLDHRKITPSAFRQSGCPGGLALNVEFNLRAEAENFAAAFTGRVRGEQPLYPRRPATTAQGD